MASQYAYGEPPSLSTPENKVQLAKAQFCQALEKMFGGDFKLWLRALKKLEAKGSVKPGPYLEALHELIAELERLQQKGRISDE